MQDSSGVTYKSADAGYFEKRGLSRYAGSGRSGRWASAR